MNSEIFDEYAKIAAEQGLVKGGLVKRAEGSEPHPRYDSLTQADIASLYGVEPDGKQDHIVEQAHPEPMIIAPAYDRVNGLVENLLERQNIIHSIVTKPNHGKHIQERYVCAHEELVNELVKTAFLLDRNGHEELMVLADNCANSIVKMAFPWLLLGAGILGAAGLINNFGGMIDRGVRENSTRAIEELQELYDNVPQLSGRIDALIADIEYVKAKNEELTQFNVILDKGDNTDVNDGKKLLRDYIKGVRGLSDRIRRFMPLLSGTEGEESWLTKYLGDPGSFIEEYMVKPIAGTDAGHVSKILETLQESLQESITSMSNLYRSIRESVKKGDSESLEDLLGQDLNAPEPKKEELEKNLELPELTPTPTPLPTIEEDIPKAASK